MVNSFHGVGNLGKDPESSSMSDGKAISKFSIAIKDQYNKDHTEWVRVVAFGKLAEICNQYLVKGKQVYIEGRLKTNKWTDKEGNDRYTTEIIASTMQMLGSKSDGGGQETAPPPDLDSIPF
jgi:single-strand DNA-binding protein